MWKRSLFFVAICVSFFLGVCGAQLLRAGYGWSSCSAGNTCPSITCNWTTGTTVLNTYSCDTCGTPGTTCKAGSCGGCTVDYFSPCCLQNYTCPGQYTNSGKTYYCSCGAKQYKNNANLPTPFCQRKPSIWTLFATW